MKIIEILGRASKLNVLYGACNSERPGLFGHDRENHMKIIEILGRASKLNDALFKVILRRGRYIMAKWFFNKMLRSAMSFYEDMKSRGISPDVVTYNTMINGYYRFRKMEEAEKLFVEMKGMNVALTVISYTTVTNNSIFLSLLSSQCRAGDLRAAEDVQKAMIRLSIPTEAGHYGVLIENFCKVEEYDRAMKFLDKLVEKEIILRPQSTLEMESNAYNPEIFFRPLMKKGVQDSNAFNNLICGHAKEGSSDSAFEIIKIMGRRGIPRDADAYILLIKSYLRKVKPADAKTALDAILEDGHVPDSSVVQTASRVMKSMVDKGVKENMDLVAKIFEASLMRGHVKEALGRIELLMHSGCHVNFDDLLFVLSEIGKTIAAPKLFDFSLERDFNVDFKCYDKKGGVTDWSSCDDLTKSLNQDGNTKKADILSRMIKGGEKSRENKKLKKQTSFAV
ncbi:hypothetical protein P3X46_009690 [Hevea brasiliensis]|uniref:Pentacotripeptide-repeat region of PRORP domain-containing protein n=1 Tax=Hevea brasiliensis TaxID=3981 RepID=A0ABQ9MQA9_HEVBR|nr:hypothetical protein P3X46_009690 [Hevea brasiliensis]